MHQYLTVKKYLPDGTLIYTGYERLESPAIPREKLIQRQQELFEQVLAEGYPLEKLGAVHGNLRTAYDDWLLQRDST
jgi:hypothetical protein